MPEEKEADCVIETGIPNDLPGRPATDRRRITPFGAGEDREAPWQ